MNEFFLLMAAPLAACILLVGIHAYLGLHVIEREVIFVDLALAQIAAFGGTVGFLWGLDLHSPGSYLVSLGFTFVGAAIFAATRLRSPVVPQEAIIGIAYAVAASAAILVLSRVPGGGEELKSLLVGHLLFIDWDEVMKIALIYAFMGAVHWFVRKPLLLISRNPNAAYAKGMPVRAWDFLFYVTFGFVVTSSVELAGVLLVFAFLVVPAACGVLLADSIRARLVVGWVSGVLTSAGGVVASYLWDFPTGATVVCAFGFCLLISVLLRALKRRH